MVKRKKRGAPAVKNKTRQRQSQPSDFGTPELLQHGEYTVEAGQYGRRLKNKSPDPISFYFNRNYITQRQKEAAERWEKDYYLSGAIKPMSPQYKADRVDGLSALEQTEKQLHYYQRWSRAYVQVKGRRHAEIAFHIICIGFLAADLDGVFPYYNKASQLMPPLKEAMDDLAAFYGIPHYVQ